MKNWKILLIVITASSMKVATKDIIQPEKPLTVCELIKRDYHDQEEEINKNYYKKLKIKGDK